MAKARATSRSPAQLDREIAHALARTRPRLHHETKRDPWDVAMDAILEHDPEKAAETVRHIRDEQGVAATETVAFAQAVRAAPADVRKAFLDLTRDKGGYALPAFYELVKHASDQRVWFKALEAMKKPGYKGLTVVWWDRERKPKKPKQASIQDFEISNGFFKRVDPHDLPDEVLARFEER